MFTQQQQHAAAILRKTYKPTASAILRVYNYKQDGIPNFKSFLEFIEPEIDRQKALSRARFSAKYVTKQYFENRYYVAHMQKQREITQIEAAKATPSRSLSYLQEKVCATYPYRKPQVFTSGWFFKADFDVFEDWDYYLKSYGKPKTEILNKRVELYEYIPKNAASLNDLRHGHFEKRTEIIPISSSFRRNWLLKALAGHWGITGQWAPKELRKVQLNKLFEIELIENRIGVEIFKRTLNGYQWDYCALDYDGTTFHAYSVRKALDGLEKKRKARIEQETKIVSYRIARSLDFCKIGIVQFCEDNGIDIDAEMTIAQLRAVVLKNRKLNCEKYRGELKQLGIVLNCK